VPDVVPDVVPSVAPTAACAVTASTAGSSKAIRMLKMFLGRFCVARRGVRRLLIQCADRAAAAK